jgi:cytochrome bd-type quinol oxidase subunit 1
MLPEDVYKRRHFGTPQSFFLITVNYVVLALAVQMFAACSHIQAFFWVVIAALTAYNVYKIRRDREEYDKIRIIAYVISVAGMVLLFFAFRINLHC